MLKQITWELCEWNTNYTHTVYEPSKHWEVNSQMSLGSMECNKYVRKQELGLGMAIYIAAFLSALVFRILRLILM
jgi:hypothetical protein